MKIKDILEGEVVPFANKFEKEFSEIKKMKTSGIGRVDSKNMQIIHDFIVHTKAPMRMKIEALKKHDEVFGFGVNNYDEKAVLSFIKSGKL